ncbi:MAG: hypothetical protein LBS36_07405 [Oscillospiraceae bacterium]|jgi:hypothetical protein|nr:hypothetical protein [Oscillospiraceae bacterium]
MKIKATSAKKKVFFIAMACVLVLTSVVGLYFGITKRNSPLTLSETFISYVIDIDNPSEVAGFADYVFVGRVEKRHNAKYEDIAIRWIDKGPRIVGWPYTNYDVTVLENLKGSLKRNETVSVLKDGGISPDRQYLILAEGDFMPEEGDVCAFFVSAKQDGTLSISGKNGNIKIAKSSLTEKAVQKMSSEQMRQATQNELEEIKGSSVYQTMAVACENEIPFERERHTVPMELLETLIQ